jgi:hypothetical protein
VYVYVHVHVYHTCHKIHLLMCPVLNGEENDGRKRLPALNYGCGKSKTIEWKRVGTLISTSLRPSICVSSKKWGEVYTGESHVGSLPSLVTWIRHATSVSPIDMCTNLPHSDSHRLQSHLATFECGGRDRVYVMNNRWEGWAKPFIHSRSWVNFGTVEALEEFVFR